LEDYKHAVENLFTRGRGNSSKGYERYLAMAPFYLTVNQPIPLNKEIRKRFYVIHLSLVDSFTEDEKKEYDSKVKGRLEDLKYLGYFVFKKISENPEILFKEHWISLATKLLKEAFEYAGLEVPEWVEEISEPESEELINEDINELIRSRLLKYINDQYTRYISKLNVEVIVDEDVTFTRVQEFEARVRVLLDQYLIPWAYLRGEEVIITTSILDVLEGISIDSLKTLAERLGWKYGVHKVGGRNCRSIKVSLKEFVKFLIGDKESRSSGNSNFDNRNDDGDFSDGMGLCFIWKTDKSKRKISKI